MIVQSLLNFVVLLWIVLDYWLHVRLHWRFVVVVANHLNCVLQLNGWNSIHFQLHFGHINRLSTNHVNAYHFVSLVLYVWLLLVFVPVWRWSLWVFDGNQIGFETVVEDRFVNFFSFCFPLVHHRLKLNKLYSSISFTVVFKTKQISATEDLYNAIENETIVSYSMLLSSLSRIAWFGRNY